MTRHLRIAIVAGAKTCAPKPGEFCRFVRARGDGSQPQCLLFGRRLYDESGRDIVGWLQRLPECLAAEAAS